MKRPHQRKNRFGHRAIGISAKLAEPLLLQCLVEKLADRYTDIGYGRETVQPGWRALETSSLEAHVNGDIDFTVQNEVINVPFVTSFLFTCTKAAGENYNLTWVSSLS